MVYTTFHLVLEELNTVVDVTDDNEVLEGDSSVGIDVCVDESHTHQVLVIFEIPHEYL